MSKFKEMDYLIDKLVDKKKKEIDKIENKFLQNGNVKSKTLDYDEKFDNESVKILKEVLNSNIPRRLVREYFGHLFYKIYTKEEEQIYLYQNVYKEIEVDVYFEKRHFLGLQDPKQQCITLNLTNVSKDEEINKPYIKELMCKPTSGINTYVKDNFINLLSDNYRIVGVYGTYKESYEKPTKTYTYIDKSDIRILKNKKQEIRDKYDELIKQVKKDYIPDYLQDELI